MAILIETDTGTVDLSSATAGGVFASFTAPRPGLYTADIRLSSLQSDTDTITMRLLRFAADGSTLISKGAISSTAKGLADPSQASTVYGNTLGSNQWMFCNAGEILKCHAVNSTSESATAAFTVNWFDPTGFGETNLLTLARMQETFFNNIRYVATTGNDSNSGLDPAAPKLTIRSALTASAAGDLVRVGPGTYATAGVDAARLTVPDGVSVFGAGRDVTLVTGTQSGIAMGPILSFLGGGSARDMTISGSASGSTVAAGACDTGTDVPAGGNIELTRMRLIGRTDGLLLNLAGAVRMRVQDSDIRCLYDAVAIGGAAHDAFIERCNIEAIGPNSTNRACGVSLQVGSPTVHIRDSAIKASGSNGTVTGNGNYGVQLLALGTAGQLRLDNCDVHAAAHTVESYDVDNLQTGGAIILSGTRCGVVHGPSITRKQMSMVRGFFPPS